MGNVNSMRNNRFPEIALEQKYENSKRNTEKNGGEEVWKVCETKGVQSYGREA